MGWGGRVLSTLRHGWNAFMTLDQNPGYYSQAPGPTYSSRPDRTRLRFTNEKSIVSAIYTRMGVDAASVGIHHVRLDSNGRYTGDVDSGLNNCLTVEANKDQGATAFRQDVAMTLFDKGVVAIVPVDATMDPMLTGGYDINTLRVGEIISWAPDNVQVRLYDDRKGIKRDIWLPKKFTAVVENPMYSVMNEPNSTLQRLIRKLNLLDAIDEQSGSGKLDIIVQLPYTIRSETKKIQAEKRRQDIEVQLRGAQYGVAYVDATEKITQLNRPVTNNLLDQIQMLTEWLYEQLGLTKEIMNGSANEATMLGYYARTIEPVLTAVCEGLARTFLTKTARSQGQSVIFMRDMFKLVPVSSIADIADKLVRNRVFSSNDMRAILGYRPDTDPQSDKLINHNLPLDQQQPSPQQPQPQELPPPKGGLQNGT